MTLEDWRARMDEIDEAIVRLLNERAACAVAIGRIKRQEGIAVYQPERERHVVERARALTAEIGGSLGPAAIGRLFERIIDEARGLELAHHAGAGSDEDGGTGNQE
jgi:chorismate mutase